MAYQVLLVFACRIAAYHLQNKIHEIHLFLLQDRFDEWESSGVKVVPVLSQPESDWTGESGYVQVGLTLDVSFSLSNSVEIVRILVNRPIIFLLSYRLPSVKRRKLLTLFRLVLYSVVRNIWLR